MGRKRKNLQALEKTAENITSWVGSIPSLIVHTILFVVAFMLPVFGILEFDQMLLILTTILSLEAIYLSIFIQLSVNRSQEHIEDLIDDVSEIQEDIEDIQVDIEESNEDEDEEEDHSERARTVMLKSKVALNKTEINSLKNKIAEMQALILELQKEDDEIEDELGESEENY